MRWITPSVFFAERWIIEMNKKRIEWIDYLGGAAVLWVFMQHSMVPVITRVLLAFHMPLFFWISGFLFREKCEEKISSQLFIIKRAKRLLVPWILWVLIDYIITAVVQVRAETFEIREFVLRMFQDICYGESFWFFPCMFVSELIFHTISKVALKKVVSDRKKECYCLLLAVGFWIASYGEQAIIKEPLLFRLDVSLMAVGLLFFGAGSHKICIQIKKLDNLIKNVLMIFFLGIAFVCIVLNGRDGSNFMMASNAYGNYYFAILAAGCLIFANILMFDLGEKVLCKKYLLFLRSNSLLLFPLHVTILRIFNYYFSMSDWNMWISAGIRIIIIHIFIIPCCYIVNRYIPILGGKMSRGSKK